MVKIVQTQKTKKVKKVIMSLSDIKLFHSIRVMVLRGYSLDQLRNIPQLGFNPIQINRFTFHLLINANLSVKQILDSGFSKKSMIDAGFRKQLQESGFIKKVSFSSKKKIIWCKTHYNSIYTNKNEQIEFDNAYPNSSLNNSTDYYLSLNAMLTSKENLILKYRYGISSHSQDSNYVYYVKMKGIFRCVKKPTPFQRFLQSCILFDESQTLNDFVCYTLSHKINDFLEIQDCTNIQFDYTTYKLCFMLVESRKNIVLYELLNFVKLQ